MSNTAQPQLGLHQGKASAGLQETLGVMTIEFSFEDHLTQRWLQLNLFNFADIDPAIADRAANPEPRIVISDQREGAYFRTGLLFTVKQLMAATAIGQPVELDGTAQQGRQITDFDLDAINPDPGIDGRFLPELRLLGEEGGIHAINF